MVDPFVFVGDLREGMTLAYRKLRTSRTGLASSSRLYMGEDHILSIESNAYSEKYYRFYFSEIQSIIVRRTGRGAIWSVVLGFIALLMTTCSIGAIPAGKWAPTPGYFTLALIAAGIMAVNLLKGPSCQTYIQTNVTVQKVGALHRLKKTEEILPEIRSHIRAAQGSVTREQIIQGTVMPEEEISTEREPAEEGLFQEQKASVINPERYHKFAFSMILISAALDTLWMFVHGLFFYMIVAVGTMAGFISIIAALIVQTRQNTSEAVRKVTWALFVTHLAAYCGALIINVYYSFREGLSGNDTFGSYFSQFTELVDKGWMDKTGLVFLSAVSIAISVILGTAGLYYLAREKRDAHPLADELPQE